MDEKGPNVNKRIVCAVTMGILAILFAVGGVILVKNIRNGNANKLTLKGIEEGTSLEGDVKLIGHRGYAGVTPENTVTSFTKAVKAGADMVELDAQMTKDGRIVVFHDDTLNRITGAEGRVSDYTLEEIQSMDAGTWFGSEFSGEKIPTLNEALYSLWVGNTKIYLEIKDIGEAATNYDDNMPPEMPRQGYIEKVVGEVQILNMMDRVIFASFNYDYLKQVKDIVPDGSILYNTNSGDVYELLSNYPADYYGVNVDGIKPNTILGLHEQGKPVYVWTVDDPDVAQRLIKMGVDGIVTNQVENIGEVIGN